MLWWPRPEVQNDGAHIYFPNVRAVPELKNREVMNEITDMMERISGCRSKFCHWQVSGLCDGGVMGMFH